MTYENTRLWSYFYMNRCTIHNVESNSGLVDTFTQMDHLDVSERPKRLSVAQNYLGVNGALPLIDVIACWLTLEEVDFSDNYLDTRAVAYLAEMAARHPTLTKIDLSNNPLFDTTGRILLKLVRENQNVVDVGLRNIEMRHSFREKIKEQLTKNRLKASPSQMSRTALFRDLSLPPLPSSPHPVDSAPKPKSALHPSLRTFLKSLFVKNDSDSSDRLWIPTPQCEEFRSQLVKYGKLALLMHIEEPTVARRAIALCEEFLPTLTDISQPGGARPVIQYVNRLKKNFPNGDPILELITASLFNVLQTRNVTETVEQAHATEVAFYVNQIRAKVRGARVGTALHHKAKRIAEICEQHLQTNFGNRRLIYLTDRISYFEPELGQYVVNWMRVEPVPLLFSDAEWGTPLGSGSRGSLWDDIEIVEAVQRHFVSNQAAYLERHAVLRELLQVAPPVVFDFAIAVVMGEVSGIPAIDSAWLPTKPRMATLVDEATDGSFTSECLGARNFYGRDLLQIAMMWWSSEVLINWFVGHFLQWLLEQDEEFIERSASEVDAFSPKFD